jgi:Collagen triple helix repeat (20 copies)/Divergent InlB B-repeat domain
MRMLRKRSLLALGGSVALLAGTGAVYAAVPDAGTNVYHACMLNGIGTVRIIDPSLASSNPLSHCTKLETAIAWNQTGQQGPAGTAGAAGPQGPAGAAGATGAQGPAGPAGADGKDGKDGQDGATGPPGPAGTIGATGATGPQGPKGDPGPSGSVTSLDDLVGKPCNTSSPDAGVVAIDYGGAPNYTISYSCVPTTLHTLTVTPNQDGVVTSNDGVINCGATCSAPYDSDTVTLYAAGDAGHVFEAWGGDCSGQSGACVLSMTSDHNVTAYFISRQYSVSVGTNDGGYEVEEASSCNIFSTCYDDYWTAGAGSVSGSVDCGTASSGSYENDCGSVEVDYGTVLTFTETTTFGNFAGWSGPCSGTGPTCTFTVQGTTDLEADWNPPPAS